MSPYVIIDFEFDSSIFFRNVEMFKSSMFFAAGLSTLLQSLLGARLPILQGASFTFVTPAIALLTSPRFICEEKASGEENDYIWKERIAALQGGLIVASIVEIFIGAFGLVGFLLRYIGPLTIAPVLVSIGIALAEPAVNYCSGNWAVASIVIFILILCSNVISWIKIPIFSFSIKDRNCT